MGMFCSSVPCSPRPPRESKASLGLGLCPVPVWLQQGKAPRTLVSGSSPGGGGGIQTRLQALLPLLWLGASGGHPQFCSYPRPAPEVTAGVCFQSFLLITFRHFLLYPEVQSLRLCLQWQLS